ncbi:MAG: acyl-CoA thioesterase [Planctomycetota bacterium]
MADSTRPPEPFAIQIRVRYSDTDCSGAVYHAKYLDYFEWSRTELLRAAGHPYRSLEASGVALVVVSANVAFHRPARYDDLLEVVTTVTGETGARLTLGYELLRLPDRELLATGETVLACVDAQSRKARRLPPLFHATR